jgi:hypothetical protein
MKLRFERLKRCILLVLLAVSVLALAFEAQPVKADEYIYIMRDGRIIQPLPPLIYTPDNHNYFFISDIVDYGIRVEAGTSNIVLNGMGHSLRSDLGVNEVRDGINIPGVDNYPTVTQGVTIENMTISGFHRGVYIFAGCQDITIRNTVIINNPLAGISLTGCIHTVIVNNNITDNLGYGILDDYGSSDFITDNTIAGAFLTGEFGVMLSSTSHAWVERNNITENGYGLGVDNTMDIYIFHNNFVGNQINAIADSFLDAYWNSSYPTGGNYWDTYHAYDLFNGPHQNVTGLDGIGDADSIMGGLYPYVVNGPNMDYYPFMSESGWKNSPISIRTNVTVMGMKANTYCLKFIATGPHGTTGYINASVPMGLNSTDITVYINGTKLIPPPFPIITNNGTYYFIYFEFSLSEHTMMILFANAHDVAVTKVMPCKTIVGQGYSAGVNVTVANLGTYTEDFNVTVYANTTSIARQNITLTSEKSATMTFTWNTKGFAKGNYTISASASLLGDMNVSNNDLTSSVPVEITILGDVDGNRVVNILDVIKISSIYHSKRGDPNFNPDCDLDDDGTITILDLVTCTTHYGQKWP